MEQKSGWNFVDDLLYWRAHQDGLGFTNKASNVLTTDDFTHGSIVHPDFDWKYGFRLGLGYTLCDGSWTFDAEWIDIDSKANGKVEHNSGAPDFKGSFPIYALGKDTLAGDYVSESSLNWHLDSDIIDVNAQYNYLVCQDFMLMPFAGIRGVSFRQKISTKYEGGTFASGQDHTIIRNQYYGAGPRFGANADYRFWRCFSIFGSAAVAPLYGQHKTKAREYYLDVERYRKKGESNHFVLSFDYSIGIQWKGLILESWPSLTLGASWEGQNFYRQNKVPGGPHGFFKNYRTLILEGLTLSAAFDF